MSEGPAAHPRCRNALVIRPGALGDTLLTLPVLQAIQEAWPQAEIDWMGNLAVLRWLPRRSVVRGVRSFEWPDLGTLFNTQPRPSRKLQEYLGRYDLVLSYAAPPDSVFAHNLTPLISGTAVSWDARPGDHLREHMSVYLQRPLVQLGIMPSDEFPSLALTQTDRAEAAQWWAAQRLGSGLAVAIHPGSGSRSKNWPANRFAELARTVMEQLKARVLLVQGPADEDAVAGVTRALRDDQLVPVRDMPLPALAAILERCSAYVGNDSGVSHLAAAIGVASLVIFGPTNPQVWAPRGRQVRVVAANMRGPRDRGPGERWHGRPVEDVSVRATQTALYDLLSSPQHEGSTNSMGSGNESRRNRASR